jgi:hypothetical protein
MESKRNWPAWGALVLAGLALFVALSGRFGGAVSLDRFTASFGPQDQTAQAQVFPVPQAGGSIQSANDAQIQAQAQALEAQAQALRDKLQNQPDAPGTTQSGPSFMPPMAPPGAPDAPQLKVAPSTAPQLKGLPPTPLKITPGGRGGFRTGGPHLPFGGFFGFPFGLVGGLPQALLIGGLLFLAWRRFGRRGQTAPAPSAARRAAVTKRLDPNDGDLPRS